LNWDACAFFSDWDVPRLFAGFGKPCKPGRIPTSRIGTFQYGKRLENSPWFRRDLVARGSSGPLAAARPSNCPSISRTQGLLDDREIVIMCCVWHSLSRHVHVCSLHFFRVLGLQLDEGLHALALTQDAHDTRHALAHLADAAWIGNLNTAQCEC